MKTFYSLFASFLICSFTVFAQDTSLSVTSNGNVGIGTSNPNEKLEIRAASATIRIAADDLNKSSLQFYEMTNGVPYGYEFQYDGSEDKLNLWSRGFTGNEAIRVTFRKDGAVGIGTTTPGTKLDVEGNITLSGELRRGETFGANLVPIAYANVNSDGTINSDATTSNVSLSSHTAGSGNYYFTIDGYNVYYDQTMCIATLRGGSPGSIGWSSSGGGATLYIGTKNGSGVAEDMSFTFIVYKK